MTGRLEIDPLTGAPILIVGHRQYRPEVVDPKHCPFCPGGLEAPDGYDDAIAFPNRWPPLRHSKVVLYSPDHDGSLATLGVAAVRRVVDLWADVSDSMLTDGAGYVLVFENRGPEAGATIAHPHGQVYGFDDVPPVPAREAELAEVEGCTVCTELETLRDVDELVVSSTSGWRAWAPAASAHPYEVRLAPEEHVADLAALDAARRDAFATALVDVVGRYDRAFEAPFPYHMWIHPGFHLHVHFAPPLRSPGVRRFIAAADLGGGVLANPIPPADAAARLRSTS